MPPRQVAAVPDGLESGKDFPIVCDVCLGPNPYIRMIKQVNHKECKVSGRVFTSFRWRPGAGARYKETVICPEVARAKGVCQCCLMDMEFNLPVGLRDALLRGTDEGDNFAPQSGVNQTYHYDQVAKANREDVEASYGKMANEKLLKMARTSPYYDRNLPKLCSFWLKGQCTRVVENTCPFRPCCGSYRFPELAGSNPEGMKTLIAALDQLGPLKVMKDNSQEMEEIKEQLRSSQRGSRDQNIRDRYHGVDTLTQKYLGKAEQLGLEPPEDKSITTIWVGLVPGNPVTERDVMDQFYAYGEVKSVQIVLDANCAFVTYTTREAAEQAVEKLHGNLTINGLKLKIQWGKPQRARGPEGIGGVPQLPTAYPMAPVAPGAPMPYIAPYPQSNLPPPPPGKPPPPPPPGSGMPRPVYPSMDPSFHGTRPDRLPPPPPGRPPQKK